MRLSESVTLQIIGSESGDDELGAQPPKDQTEKLPFSGGEVGSFHLFFYCFFFCRFFFLISVNTPVVL